MRGCTVTVIVSILFAMPAVSVQLEEEMSSYADASLYSLVHGRGEKEESLALTELGTDEIQREDGYSRRRREMRDWGRGRPIGRQPGRGAGPRGRGRHSKRKEETPQEKLRKLTERLFRRIASFKIPKGYVLPFCFKDTTLNDEIEQMSSTCDRMGVDWSCVFAELAGGDNGFSLKTLASKFSEVEEKSLNRGLKSAIVACDEYWQQYKHGERRRLLLHELEMEVISRTWVEHGNPIGEPHKPKRLAEDLKNETNPLSIRIALLNSGMADYSVEPDSNQGNESLVLTSRSPTRRSKKSRIATNHGNQFSSRYSTQRHKRSWRENGCINSPEYGKSTFANDELLQESSDSKTKFFHSLSVKNERCRRDDAQLDRIKQERERKRQETLKRKELREEAQRRIEELRKQGGGKEGELQALLDTAKNEPEVESKLGQHLEREERIEEDLRSQVSSCITEEATKDPAFIED
ncbi:uncharacterized protein LOC124160653 isoform X3 [Ischnura elegans]|uniref:uncharacterized protein LOC124160653 isoform X3 n=1 Tax=Ischnura elegans TaxID=197161 RepID=UPI001ED89801|nr:uncharacterized protein LOC124160653 isoform X3 [Ischnura elegans]